MVGGRTKTWSREVLSQVKEPGLNPPAIFVKGLSPARVLTRIRKWSKRWHRVYLWKYMKQAWKPYTVVCTDPFIRSSVTSHDPATCTSLDVPICVSYILLDIRAHWTHTHTHTHTQAHTPLSATASDSSGRAISVSVFSSLLIYFIPTVKDAFVAMLCFCLFLLFLSVASSVTSENGSLSSMSREASPVGRSNMCVGFSGCGGQCRASAARSTCLVLLITMSSGGLWGAGAFVPSPRVK